MSKPEMYECIEGFVTNDGVSVAVGDLAEAGAAILKRHEWAFKPFDGARFKKDEEKAKPKRQAEPKIEQATAAPGEKRGAKK